MVGICPRLKLAQPDSRDQLNKVTARESAARVRGSPTWLRRRGEQNGQGQQIVEMITPALAA